MAERPVPAGITLDQPPVVPAGITLDEPGASTPRPDFDVLARYDKEYGGPKPTMGEMAKNTALALPMLAVGPAATAMAGSTTPLVAGLGRALSWSPALSRVLTGGATGGAEAAVEGTSIPRGAAVGAGAATLAEGGGALLSKVLRSAPGAKTRIAEEDARNLRRFAEETSPPLAGAQTPGVKTAGEQLNAMAAGPGKDALGRGKEAVARQIDNMLAGNLLDVPALSSRPVTFREASAMLTELGEGMRHMDILDPALRQRVVSAEYGRAITQLKEALDRAQLGVGQPFPSGQYGPREPLALPARTESGVPGPARTFEQGAMGEAGASLPSRSPEMGTPREGVAATLQAAEAALAGRPTTPYYTPTPPARNNIIIETTANSAREVPGASPTRMRRDVVEPPTGPVRPVTLASEVFEGGQKDYRSGLKILEDVLGPGALYRPGNAGIELNTAYLQKKLMNPDFRADLEWKLGKPAVDKLVDVVTRGAGLGAMDRVPAGGGGLGQSVGEWLRGGNSGAWGLPQALIRALVPNVGASYVGATGRVPMTLPPQLQAILDLAAQRASERPVP